MSSRETIWFFSEGTDYTLKNKGHIRKWLRTIIREEKYKTGELNFIFCPDDYLLEINSKYLNHNTLTDIVTFDLSEQTGIIQGDIYISVDRARDNAGIFKVPFQEEIRRLLAHGVLHLMGYKDKTPEDKAVMTARENYCLSLPAN